MQDRLDYIGSHSQAKPKQVTTVRISGPMERTQNLYILTLSEQALTEGRVRVPLGNKTLRGKKTCCPTVITSLETTRVPSPWKNQ